MNFLPGWSPGFMGIGKPWTPEELTTVSGWWDAADTSTVTTSSGRVSSWASKSPGTINLVQGTGSAQPAYVSGQYVDFDTNGRRLTPSSTWPSQWDFYCVGRPTASTFWVTLLWSNPDNLPAIRSTGSTAWGRFDTGVFAQFGSQTWPNQDGLALVRAGTSGVMSGNRDGGTIATASGGINTTVQSVGGNVNDNAQNFGRLYEAILVPSNLSTDLQQKVEGYLAHKWGLTSLLPSGHPYKSRPPTV